MGLLYGEYITVFETAGFIRVKGDQVEFRSDRFQNFINEFKLQLEIDVSNITVDDQFIKRCHTVSVGSPRKHLDIPIARDQFKMIESRLRLKPRMNICHEQAILRSHLDFVLNECESLVQSSLCTASLQCSEENNQTVVPDEIKSAGTVEQEQVSQKSEIPNQETLFNQPVNECLLALRTTELINGLLSKLIKTEVLDSLPDFLSENFDPLTFADSVMETSKAIVQLRNGHRALKQHYAGITAPIGDLSQLVKPGELARKYPMLHHLNVDLSTVLEIHGLLRDILNLAKDIDDLSLLDFSYMNGKPCTIIAVPKCSQKEYFNATAKSWIFRMLDGLIDTQRRKSSGAGHDVNDNTATGLGAKRSRKDAACWIVSFLGKTFPDESLEAMTDLGLVSSCGQLTPEELQAMVDEGNISQRALRVIRKYLSGTSKNKRQNIFPSEQKLRALGSTDPLLPTYAKTKTAEGKTIHYWYKPLDQLLTSYLLPAFSKEWRFLKFTLGADHGAGAEQVGVLVEAFTGDNKLAYTEVFRVGEIECTKETSDILMESLAQHVNCGLNNMLQDGILCEGPGPDGTIQFQGSRGASFVLRRDDQNDEIVESGSATSIHPVPFKVHMTGDMAWYAVALGKENSATNWCWICQLKKSEWQKRSSDGGPRQGSLWSLQELRETVNLRLRSEKSYLGVKRSPLIEKLGPDRYEIPTLHLQLGITNNLIDCILRYAQERHGVEKMFGVPTSVFKKNEEMEKDLQVCWQEYHKHVAICFKKREEMAQWDKDYGQLLLETRLAKKALLEFLEFEGDTLPPAERRELEKDRMTLHVDIAKLNADRKVLETAEKDAVLAFKTAERNLHRLQDQDAESHVIRTRIDEEALIPFGAERPPEHGGQFHGGACKIIMGNAREIFEVIMEIFEEVESENGVTHDGKCQTKKFLEYVRDCLILFDGYFSCLYTPMNSMALENDAEEVKEKAKGFLDTAINLWEALSLPITPKVHVAWTHSIERLPYSSEQWVERLHQERHKNLSRLRGLRNRKHRYTAQSQFSWRNKMANVSEIQEKVRQKRALPEETANLRSMKRHCSQATNSSNEVCPVKAGGIDRKIVREETLKKWIGTKPEKLPTATQLNTDEAIISR